jgi:hypothetical protein
MLLVQLQGRTAGFCVAEDALSALAQPLTGMVHGSGTYIAYVGPGSKHQDQRSAQTEARTYGKHVTRFAMPPDAKIISEDDLKTEQKADLKRLDAEHLAGKVDNKAYNAMRALIDDRGRYATLKGYDAITVPRRGHMVVLNRSIVAVQRSNF